MHAEEEKIGNFIFLQQKKLFFGASQRSVLGIRDVGENSVLTMASYASVYHHHRKSLGPKYSCFCLSDRNPNVYPHLVG